MKTNTLRQRLAVYKKALEDYENYERSTRFGTCYWFANNTDLCMSEELVKYAPELCKHKPKKMYDDWYWFKEGELPPRIALLKKAIRYTESQIKKGKK